jgi:hypothetical protein
MITYRPACAATQVTEDGNLTLPRGAAGPATVDSARDRRHS